MPRRPKPKNTLSAGERARLYEEILEEKQKRLSAESDDKALGEKGKISPAKKEAKILPRPEFATVYVNFSDKMGEVKPVHGMCNGPLSYGADISEIFCEIGVPYVRFDCTDGAFSAFGVDISRIFKDPNADPFDEESYDFSLTDKYVEAALKCGAQIVYRMGESIDMLRKGEKTKLPESSERLIQVIIKIIDHYNDYFAKGYSLDLRCFELWSQGVKANGERVDILSENYDIKEECELYCKIAEAVKLHDKRLLTGGGVFDVSDKKVREFISYCKKRSAPLDFLTLSAFSSDPRAISEKAEKIYAYARNAGYQLELFVGKWNYADKNALGDKSLERLLRGEGKSFIQGKKELFREMSSIKGAAFCSASLIEMASVEGIKGAMYYDAQPLISPFCGIADRAGEKSKPFYAFEAYGKLYRTRQAVFCNVTEKSGYAHSGIYAMAVRGEHEGYILISSFEGCGTVDLRLEEIPAEYMNAEVYILDGVKNMEKGDDAPISGMKKRLVLNLSEYGVVLIRLY